MPSFEPLDLPGPVLVTLDVHSDERGFLMERWKRSVYARHGIDADFVQDNHSRSARGVLRGLHWQVPPHAQGKLVSVLRGEILDVMVDLRRGSPTFGRWAGVVLSEENRRQLWVPPGFAHGFLVRSEVADVVYKASGEHAPDAERGLRWDDPAIGIDWGLEALARDEAATGRAGSGRPVQPRLSERDGTHPGLADLTTDDLFEWEEP